jgi:hypothetical protein
MRAWAYENVPHYVISMCPLPCCLLLITEVHFHKHVLCCWQQYLSYRNENYGTTVSTGLPPTHNLFNNLVNLYGNFNEYNSVFSSLLWTVPPQCAHIFLTRMQCLIHNLKIKIFFPFANNSGMFFSGPSGLVMQTTKTTETRFWLLKYLQ